MHRVNAIDLWIVAKQEIVLIESHFQQDVLISKMVVMRHWGLLRLLVIFLKLMDENIRKK